MTSCDHQVVKCSLFYKFGVSTRTWCIVLFSIPLYVCFHVFDVADLHTHKLCSAASPFCVLCVWFHLLVEFWRDLCSTCRVWCCMFMTGWIWSRCSWGRWILCNALFGSLTTFPCVIGLVKLPDRHFCCVDWQQYFNNRCYLTFIFVFILASASVGVHVWSRCTLGIVNQPLLFS